MGLREFSEEKKLQKYIDTLKEKFDLDLTKFHDKTPEGKNQLEDYKDIVNFDLDELVKGIEVEFEHTKCPYMALSITLDHLDEHKNYYSKLAKARL